MNRYTVVYLVYLVQSSMSAYYPDDPSIEFEGVETFLSSSAEGKLSHDPYIEDFVTLWSTVGIGRHKVMVRDAKG